MNAASLSLCPSVARRSLVSTIAMVGWINVVCAQPVPPPGHGNGPPINPYASGMAVTHVPPPITAPSVPADYRFENTTVASYWVFATGNGVALSQAVPPDVIYWSLDMSTGTGAGKWLEFSPPLPPLYLTAYRVLPGQVIHLTWPADADIQFDTRPFVKKE